MIVYQNNLCEISPCQLSGFCVGWKSPLDGETLHKILKNSYRIVVALDDQTTQVVGFVNSLSDDVYFAFIPMLEVLPAYQNKGIGKELLKRLFVELSSIANIDVLCDKELQSYYEKFGMMKSYGMVFRK